MLLVEELAWAGQRLIAASCGSNTATVGHRNVTHSSWLLLVIAIALGRLGDSRRKYI